MTDRITNLIADLEQDKAMKLKRIDVYETQHELLGENVIKVRKDIEQLTDLIYLLNQSIKRKDRVT